MTENSTAGLFMLKAEVSVTVTREEHHQLALTRYPVSGNAVRHLAVELAWCTVGFGKYKGEQAVEVRLDGQRVGELTYAMSQRYGPVVDAALDRGGRPGCEAIVHVGKRGIEVELMLPRDTSKTAGPGAAPTSLPGGASSPRSGRTLGLTRPENTPVSSQNTAYTPTSSRPTYVNTGPANRPSGPDSTHTRSAGNAKMRKSAWITGGAVVAVLFIGIAANQGDKSTPTSSTAPLNSTTSSSVYQPPVTSSSTVSSTSSTTTTPPVSSTVAIDPVAPKVETSTRTKATTSTTEKAPPKTTSSKAPTGGGCDPNYSGCVPIASDVDCAGGSGNGPAYVKGPIRVIGNDIYGLDNDHDGIACE
ncbi:hypothetical protein ACFQ1S_16060 [Kibdelosporangium lantanae]|uniref:Excalibur calcium-binding domain-containing protein n=1 Tax=Kibdelosporangium lantanae TaxID=1497396 RepID=A0ABW3M896_9PSEU